MRDSAVLTLVGCSSTDGLGEQNHHLKSDAGRNRKPVEVKEEGSHTGEFGYIENEATV